MTTFSGVYQLYSSIPISSRLNIIWNIPYINTSYDINYGYSQQSVSEGDIGNIFVGLQTKPKIIENQISIFSFGLFIPTCTEYPALNGILADYYYFNKYLPNTFGLYFNYAYHHINNTGFSYGIELGPNLLIPTKDNNSNTDLYVHYGDNRRLSSR